MKWGRYGEASEDGQVSRRSSRADGAAGSREWRQSSLAVGGTGVSVGQGRLHGFDAHVAEAVGSGDHPAGAAAGGARLGVFNVPRFRCS